MILGDESRDRRDEENLGLHQQFIIDNTPVVEFSLNRNNKVDLGFESYYFASIPIEAENTPVTVCTPELVRCGHDLPFV
jgi:hypothetical protein